MPLKHQRVSSNSLHLNVKYSRFRQQCCKLCNKQKRIWSNWFETGCIVSWHEWCALTLWCRVDSVHSGRLIRGGGGYGGWSQVESLDCVVGLIGLLVGLCRPHFTHFPSIVVGHCLPIQTISSSSFFLIRLNVASSFCTCNRDHQGVHNLKHWDWGENILVHECFSIQSHRSEKILCGSILIN